MLDWEEALKLKWKLKSLVEDMPFGIENAETITIHNKNGGLGTMGPNMTEHFIKKIKEAKQLLSEVGF